MRPKMLQELFPRVHLLESRQLQLLSRNGCSTPTRLSLKVLLHVRHRDGDGVSHNCCFAELSEFVCPYRVLGRELSEFLSAYYLCDKADSPSSSQNSPSLPQDSLRLSEFSSPKQNCRNSIPPVSYSRRKMTSSSHQGGPQITGGSAQIQLVRCLWG